MTRIFLFLSLLSGFVLVGCVKEEPETPNEEELITTLRLTMTPTGTNGMPALLTFTDLDGDGGDAPVVTTTPLTANTTYSAMVEVLNEIENPAENITEEVEEEGAEHQFFYTVDQGLLQVSYDDTDENGFPIGIETTITTGGVGSGPFSIVLRHEPNKEASGVSDGAIANAGGETDIEVTFNIEIQ